MKDSRDYVQDGPFDFFRKLTSHIKKLFQLCFHGER